MAVKAIAAIKTVHNSVEPDGLAFLLDISSNQINRVVDHFYQSELSMNATATAINNDLLAYVKSYCEEEFEIEFGLLDTVRLIIGADGLFS